MVEKKEFHCHEAPNRIATEKYCIETCDSKQKGAKAECPESVRLHPFSGPPPEEQEDK